MSNVSIMSSFRSPEANPEAGIREQNPAWEVIPENTRRGVKKSEEEGSQ